MRLDLDASALVQLIQREAETEALRRYLRRHFGDRRVGSVLARVEVVRAVRGGGQQEISHARRLLGGLSFVPLHRALLDEAAVLGSGRL